MEIPVAEETSKAVGTATFADSRDVHISKNNSSRRDATEKMTTSELRPKKRPRLQYHGHHRLSSNSGGNMNTMSTTAPGMLATAGMLAGVGTSGINNSSIASRVRRFRSNFSRNEAKRSMRSSRSRVVKRNSAFHVSVLFRLVCICFFASDSLKTYLFCRL